MDPDASPSIAPAARPAVTLAASSRLRIARIAAEAASAVPGVVGLQSGPLGLQMTGGSGQRVGGVVVTALHGGRYEVDLHLACELVPLPALGESVRAAVLDATAAAGLGAAVGPVHVRIEQIADS